MEQAQSPTQRPRHWTNFLFMTITNLLTFSLIPIYFIYTSPSWYSVILLVVMYVFTGISITAGYHRLFSHRAYDAHWSVRLFFLLFGAAAFEGSVVKWSSDHRRHHNECDHEDDPYNINNGFWWAHYNWLFYKNKFDKIALNLPDLMKDPLVRFQHKYYSFIAGFMCFLFPTLLGLIWGDPLGGFVLGGLLRMFLVHHSTFFINSLCHMWGPQPYNKNNTAKDNWLVAFLTFGEGYHNFHHKFPSDYRNAIRWWQWDPSKWTIGALSYLGLAKKLKTTSPQKITLAKLQNHTSPTDSSFLQLESIKKKIDQAQKQLEQMKTQYREAKKSFVAQDTLKNFKKELTKLKLELKFLKHEFNFHYQRSMLLLN